MLPLAKRFLRQVLDTLGEQIVEGVPVVGLEPSCVSVFRDELPNLFPGDEDARRLAKQTFTLSEFLEREAPEGWAPELKRRAIVQAHCHHKAVIGLGAERRMMEKLGLDLEILDSGCCGMAGSFGYEKEKYGVSIKAGERALLPAVRAAGKDALIIADGFSCRSQIASTTDRRALHLSQVIQMALHADGSLGDYPEARCFEERGSRAHLPSALLLGTGAVLAGGALARRVTKKTAR
jgi:Fe-S oxidoreductase